MRLVYALVFAALTTVSIGSSAFSATGEALTGLPLYPGSHPQSHKPFDTTMNVGNHDIRLKSYGLPGGSVAKSVVAWYAKQLAGSKPIPYKDSVGVTGTTFFNADGTVQVKIENSPNERFIPATLYFYRISPGFAPGDRATYASLGA
jgi:hypothetical protein